MEEQQKLRQFDRLVKKKFDVYNSLIQSLRYDQVERVGMLLPILTNQANEGLNNGLDPETILHQFFEKSTSLVSEKDKIDFMFKVIQYVERQVVLYDSVEDAAFTEMQEFQKSFSIRDFYQLLEGEKNWDRIRDKLGSFTARIVLTAHPTQFYSTSVLNIMTQLRQEIRDNELERIDQTLQQLGLTSLINSKKPSPLDEAMNIIYLMRHVYYDAIGTFYDFIRQNLHDMEFDNPNILQLGFWPGGDRDGNPFVTANITLAVADQLRMTLMKCYYRDVKLLENKLTFRHVEEALKVLKEQLYHAMFDRKYRLEADEILKQLQLIREMLDKEYFELFKPDIEELIHRVRIFGTHFASLDIRQDHSVHHAAITAILKREKIIREDLSELKLAALNEILLHREILTDPEAYDDELIQDTLQNIRNLRYIQQMNGETGCHRYIISNAESSQAVLFVYALFRWSGWSPAALSFDIVPLFETMQGMEHAEKVMKELFSMEDYRAHLQRRGHRQTIMLGFSDGTKDGGYLMANWSIFQTKEKLSRLCQQEKIKAIFFDGRGGPPARGGGKTHRFYAAQSPEIADHEIHLTIQGQTITSKYGTPEQFIFHSEQLLTAALFKHLFGKNNRISDKVRQLIGELAEISFQKYGELKSHPKFLPYLEQKSTLNYYTKANIGSRPGKRGKTAKLELSDLRAISFVGSWSQLKQNVPGYFGIGTALQTLSAKGKTEELRHLFHEVPFFKALILNSMMSLSKCNFELTRSLQKDPVFGDFWTILYEEFRLSTKMVLEISGYENLMDEEPLTRSSIRIREKIVMPLLIIQQYALQQIEKDPPNREVYEKIITRSLYGNINASRNSA